VQPDAPLRLRRGVQLSLRPRSEEHLQRVRAMQMEDAKRDASRKDVTFVMPGMYLCAQKQVDEAIQIINFLQELAGVNYKKLIFSVTRQADIVTAAKPFVVQTCDELIARLIAGEQIEHDANGVGQLILALDDTPESGAELAKFFPIVNDIITNSRQHEIDVVIHCQAGISRSATLVIAHMMYGGMTFAQAFAYLRQARACVEPNFGFVLQLQKLDAQLTAKRQYEAAMGAFAQAQAQAQADAEESIIKSIEDLVN
jgi:predicted protein tyrosine phosphatase